MDLSEIEICRWTTFVCFCFYKYFYTKFERECMHKKFSFQLKPSEKRPKSAFPSVLKIFMEEDNFLCMHVCRADLGVRTGADQNLPRSA